MIIEHAWLLVEAGREEDFMAAMREALPIIESAPGCHGAEVRRQVENPQRFILLVQWESVAAHMEGFRTSPAFEQWRALTHHFYVETPTVTHFDAPIARA